MMGNERRRKRLRLPGYDYSSSGWYFVTICTNKRESLFGNVVDGNVITTSAGDMITEVWKMLPKMFPQVLLDEMVVMPNHIHGIIVINAMGGTERNRFTRERAPTREAPTLGEVVGAYKSITTNEYIKGVKQHFWPRFDTRVWQRNFYERIIRNEQELLKMREYVANNPKMWDKDEENHINRVGLV